MIKLKLALVSEKAVLRLFDLTDGVDKTGFSTTDILALLALF